MTSITTPDITYKIFQGDISDKALEYFLSQDALGCDTETNGLSPVQNNLQLIQICSRDNKIALVQYRKHIEPVNIRTLMAAKNVTKIFHFSSFDLGFLTAQAKVTPQNIFCTKLASQAVRGAKGPKGFHKLATISNEILGINLDKTFMDGNNLPDWTGELTEKHIEYATGDVVVLLPLYDYFVNKMDPAAVNQLKVKANGTGSSYF
jgi:ribonuclease D